MIVDGLNITEFEYAYRMDGPYDPQNGFLFNKEQVLLDPYARAVAGQSAWGKSNKKRNFYHARVVASSSQIKRSRNTPIPFSDLIIYELHVRGFTKDSSSGVDNKGYFKGIIEKIPYLKSLGINAVELMPIFEFDEMEDPREVDGKTLYNYWGYSTVSFFSPNTSYSSQLEYNREGTELKKMISELHKNGIEVFLDVVFNHTAEGDTNGKIFSFKGIDNNVFYMMSPEGQYRNFSGCGNVMNCNHPIVRKYIVDCLRYWVTNFQIDGFRFDLASILGRDKNGAPLEDPPLIEDIAFDPILGDTKLIAEAWDAGGLYQVGSFPSYNRWAEWNGRYRDDLRCFLKGDSNKAQQAVNRITGSTDIYDPNKRKDASVNFINCHDGFTLYDLYAYNTKHNEKNGWGNTDGDNYNNSWNCGVEGETDDPVIIKLRSKMRKNAFATLMCSRGAVMFYAGDEFCNTQYGNNNAYCQDNITSWLDWTRLEKYNDMFEFSKRMIAFRKKHAIIRKECFPPVSGIPQISYHHINPWNQQLDYNSHYIGIMYSGREKEDDTVDDVVFLAINTYWEPINIHLPDPPTDYHWICEIDTDKEVQESYFVDSVHMTIPPRTVRIFTAEKNENK
jgi:glycogen operon protein